MCNSTDKNGGIGDISLVFSAATPSTNAMVHYIYQNHLRSSEPVAFGTQFDQLVIQAHILQSEIE